MSFTEMGEEDLRREIKSLVSGDFSDGPVVKNARNTDLIPGPGRSHMPRDS